jgi:hypothetical protein
MVAITGAAPLLETDLQLAPTLLLLETHRSPAAVLVPDQDGSATTHCCCLAGLLLLLLAAMSLM